MLFTDRGLIKTIIEKVLINAEKQPTEVGGSKNHSSDLREKILNIDCMSCVYVTCAL